MFLVGWSGWCFAPTVYHGWNCAFLLFTGNMTRSLSLSMYIHISYNHICVYTYINKGINVSVFRCLASLLQALDVRPTTLTAFADYIKAWNGILDRCTDAPMRLCDCLGLLRPLMRSRPKSRSWKKPVKRFGWKEPPRWRFFGRPSRPKYLSDLSDLSAGFTDLKDQRCKR